MKDNTIQKIEILAASRVNLLSARLEEYHIATQKYLQSSIKALQEVISNEPMSSVQLQAFYTLLFPPFQGLSIDLSIFPIAL